MLGSPDPGLGSPEGCKIVAGGRRDHRKGIPLIFSTLKGCETFTLPRAKELAPLFRVPTKLIPFSDGSATTGYYLAALRAAPSERNIIRVSRISLPGN